MDNAEIVYFLGSYQFFLFETIKQIIQAVMGDSEAYFAKPTAQNLAICGSLLIQYLQNFAGLVRDTDSFELIGLV
ncbi:hypothetical protein A8B75_06620 [Sphingomonadales bacterium EhC05]|uniref:hypothetical protein n=1 Tax=Parasphingorhabdus sp. TaxID=2709688 RepID=UPI0007F32838|nr:hypothetical protein A8B75_06620 [Sphingomonadales bacterium EhC05]